MSALLIPLLPGTPQLVGVTLAGVQYQLNIYWNDPASCWNLDLLDGSGNPLVQAIPLVTGRDLLEQYQYLGIGGQLVVQTTNDSLAVPTFDNLGTAGNLYFVTP